jgi:hypothetical protein
MTELRRKDSKYNYTPTHGVEFKQAPHMGVSCIKCNKFKLQSQLKRWNDFKVCKDGCA